MSAAAKGLLSLYMPAQPAQCSRQQLQLAPLRNQDQTAQPNAACSVFLNN